MGNRSLVSSGADFRLPGLDYFYGWSIPKNDANAIPNGVSSTSGEDFNCAAVPKRVVRFITNDIYHGH